MIFENNLLRRPTTLDLPMLLACVALASFWALPLTAENSQITTPAIEMSDAITCDTNGYCEIPYQKLSRQNEEPFLILGKVVDGRHPRYSDYKKSIGRFPNAVPCLTEPEQSTQKPNLLNIDWPILRDQGDLEVCLFRIFRSLDSQGTVRAWLKFHAFDVRGPIRRFSGNYVPSFELEPIFRISGNWNSEETMKYRPSLLWRLTGRTLVYGTSVIVGLSEKGEIVGVGVSANIE